ncbi:hypothetical protein SVIOM74S_06800 [Streptomyces violarus]
MTRLGGAHIIWGISPQLTRVRPHDDRLAPHPPQAVAVRRLRRGCRRPGRHRRELGAAPPEPNVPGRDDGSLVVATLGPAYGPEAIRTLREGFRERHPDIKLQINAVQAVDWSDFFAKILTQVADGQAHPDLVYVATEGVQLFAQRLGVALDKWVKRDAAELKEVLPVTRPARS